MLLRSIFLLALCTGLSYGVVYDYYKAEPVSQSQLRFYETENLLETCAIDIKPCDKNEWRRVDGSCNSLKYPARGTYLTPMNRLQPAHYHNRYEQRKAKSGNDLPLARSVRLNLLPDSKSSHHLFNHNVGNYGLFKFSDIGSFHDIENMLLDTTNCCQEEHMNDYACTPNIVLDTDPVLRYTNIRCINSTRPLTHQDFKCTKDEVPSVIKKATTSYDSSQIYNAKNKGDKVMRTFVNGNIIMEEEFGKTFPPNGPTAFCPNNIAPEETRCFENHFNTVLPITLLTVWYVRYHNYIANELAKINPCWDDETLFHTARDINIATSNQVYFYEWMTAVQGRENLIKEGILVEDGGFRDLYDDTKYPEVTLEYSYIIRWFHIMQESTAKLHDKHGNFIEDYELLNSTFKMGYIAKRIEEFTQSTFRAPCHGLDGTVSYDIANRGLPGVQQYLDITAGDINKGRSFGLAPYIDYVKHFLNITITSFEDLSVLLPDKCIEILKETYEDVADVDLMAALWCEKVMEGGNIPLMISKFLNDNAIRAMQTDRHWYERPNRPHAFTKQQLQEVRKESLAALMCAVADGVSEISKNAFFKISPENPLVPCSKIEKMDYNAWADDACKHARLNVVPNSYSHKK